MVLGVCVRWLVDDSGGGNGRERGFGDFGSGLGVMTYTEDGDGVDGRRHDDGWLV